MASDSRDIERMLEKVDPPRVVAGVHRDRLREELLERMHKAPAGREGARRAGSKEVDHEGISIGLAGGAAGVGLRRDRSVGGGGLGGGASGSTRAEELRGL